MSDVTTSSTSETKTTQSVVVFRAKNNNTYNRKKESKLLFHISYKIDIISSTTRALCGSVLYVDWNTPFELVTLNELTKAIFFIEESKKKGSVARDITSLMCQTCLANVSSHLLTKEDRASALSPTPIEKNLEEGKIKKEPMPYSRRQYTFKPLFQAASLMWL